jgi:hypothetical protein
VVILAEPLNNVPLIVLAVWSVVAVEALPSMEVMPVSACAADALLIAIAVVPT